MKFSDLICEASSMTLKDAVLKGVGASKSKDDQNLLIIFDDGNINHISVEMLTTSERKIKVTLQPANTKLFGYSVSSIIKQCKDGKYWTPRKNYYISEKEDGQYYVVNGEYVGSDR